jgi:hypothetical protein
MPGYADTYEDQDGNVWQFDPPYDDDPLPYYGEDD